MTLSRIFPAPHKSSHPQIAAYNPFWWGPIWRGLVVEKTGKHYHAMRSSLWLYVYLVIHADRRTGSLQRRVSTIVADMGINSRTIRRWLTFLRSHDYIITRSSGRALTIQIQRWKPLRNLRARTR